MGQTQPANPLETRTTTHRLELYGVGDDGRLWVDYQHVRKNATYTNATHISLRLPPEFGTLFDGPHVTIDELTDEERAWIDAETDAVDLREVAA